MRCPLRFLGCEKTIYLQEHLRSFPFSPILFHVQNYASLYANNKLCLDGTHVSGKLKKCFKISFLYHVQYYLSMTQVLLGSTFTMIILTISQQSKKIMYLPLSIGNLEYLAWIRLVLTSFGKHSSTFLASSRAAVPFVDGV